MYFGITFHETEYLQHYFASSILQINGLKMSTCQQKTVIDLLKRAELTLVVKAPVPTAAAQRPDGRETEPETGECVVS